MLSKRDRREMEVLRPNKTDVLPFINGDSSNCALPPRWARVTELHGPTTEDAIYEYMVRRQTMFRLRVADDRRQGWTTSRW